MITPSQLVNLSAGAIREFEAIIAIKGFRRPFLVIDEGAYHGSGANAVFDPFLKQYPTARFSDFELNPKLEDVQRGIDLYRKFQPDIVVAFGGGTAIDLAKLINALAHQTESPRDIATGKTPLIENHLPLLAVPTTSGTGSEATHFAVVYVDGEKHSLAHPSLLPEMVIYDPELTYSLPAEITAATGLDAFCQAIESIWAVGSTAESIMYATEAARLAFVHLETAVNNPTPAARLGICEAAHLAGKAINIGKTTAPHALSYPLTSLHNIPHGIAVSLTLAPMLAYNANVRDEDCNDPRGASYVQKQIETIIDMLSVQTVTEACCKIEDFIAALGCPNSLAAAGVTEESTLRRIVEGVNAERLRNNPRKATQEALLKNLRAHG